MEANPLHHKKTATLLGRKQVAVTLMPRFNYRKRLPSAPSIALIAFPLLSEMVCGYYSRPSII